MIINYVGNNFINKGANPTINNVRNYSNTMNASDVKVQFLGDSARNSHQNLLSGRMIGIKHQEVPGLVLPTEPGIIANNQLDMTTRTEIIQAPQAPKTPAIQEFIADTTM